MKKFNGMPYHLWNPFTDMVEMLKYMGFGPIVIAKGPGPYVFIEKGKKFINAFSSLWNVAIGLGREELAETAAQQIRNMQTATNRVHYPERITPAELDRMYLFAFAVNLHYRKYIKNGNAPNIY